MTNIPFTNPEETVHLNKTNAMNFQCVTFCKAESSDINKSDGLMNDNLVYNITDPKYPTEACCRTSAHSSSGGSIMTV